MTGVAQVQFAGAAFHSLRGQGVIVTGGASGIGADIVRAFAEQGCRVGFVDRDAGAGAALAATDAVMAGELDNAFCAVQEYAPCKDAIKNEIGLNRLEIVLALARSYACKQPENTDACDVQASRYLIKELLDNSIQYSARLREHAAPLELESAIRNLVINAVRYTPDQGRIEIGWRIVDNEGRLSVRDSGIGIAAEHLPRLTERFYRVDRGRSRDSGGTGLGLAIVKHVLQRHGAELRIDSTPGAGSTFAIVLPASRLRPSPATKADGAVPSATAAQ